MYDWQDPFIEEPRPRSRWGVSKTFLIGILAISLLLGFTMGMIYAGPTGSKRTSGILYDEKLVTALFESASPAVVEISIARQVRGLPIPGVGTGSGFLIDREGHIITNNHVIDGATEIRVNLADGRTLNAKKLGTSPADDLALLEVASDEVAGIAPLPLADSTEVSPGQMAIAIGSPFRQFNTITVGVVSGTGRGPRSVLLRPIPDMIQTDTALNPGNSGGPLLNSVGEVIGVNSSVRTDPTRGIEDYRIGFAVPSNTVKDLLPELITPGQVKRPWLGVSGTAVSRELMESSGLPEGVYITSVFRGSPADQAGLVPFLTFGRGGQGDIITEVDGEPVSSVEDMVSYFNKLRPGSDVTLSVFRNGRTFEFEVTLAEWPDT